MVIASLAEPTRRPRLVASFDRPYVVVICTGIRKSGRSCNRALGEVNINHPHDVRYTCRECGSTYRLQKGLS